jgi:hypothetical protein
MGTSTPFDASDIDRLRADARRATHVRAEGPDGWTKSDADPVELLAAFPALRLRAGFAIRAYQFRSGGNGNGVVWAVPEDLAFPEPGDCPHVLAEPVPGVVLAPPRPPRALDDYMTAIEAEGTPWSYLCASIFEREASELGALWHGCSWSDERVLDSAPWLERPEGDGLNVPTASHQGDWVWSEPVPRDWRPTVEQRGAEVVVSFLSFRGEGTEKILRNVDRFADGSCHFESEAVPVAYGPGGFVY